MVNLLDVGFSEMISALGIHSGQITGRTRKLCRSVARQLAPLIFVTTARVKHSDFFNTHRQLHQLVTKYRVVGLLGFHDLGLGNFYPSGRS